MSPIHRNRKYLAWNTIKWPFLKKRNDLWPCHHENACCFVKEEKWWAKTWDAVTRGFPGSLQRPGMQWQEAALALTAKVFSAAGKKRGSSGRKVRGCARSWSIGSLPQGHQGTPDRLKEESSKARVSQQEKQEKVGIGRWHRKFMFCQSPSWHRYQPNHHTVICHYWSSKTLQFWSLEIKHYCLKHVKHIR